ncbi:MAG TPA: DUF6777 domain-containing protein [Candidatus Dormibacteraeota bacterium]
MGNEPVTRLLAVPAGRRPWWGGRRRRAIAGAAALAAVTLLLVSTLGLPGHPARTTAQASGEIYLAPAAAVGANPFTASVMVGQTSVPPATAPPAQAETPPVADAQQPPAPPADQQAPPPPPPPPAAATVDAAPPTAITTVSGSVPQLYGGTVGSGACDPQRLADLLAAAPDVAADWAFAQGVDATAVPDLIQGLAPVLLLDDARVTDWRRVDGRAVPRQTVLEDGTAVLVDRFGAPRVRCLSGDPLGPPEVVSKGSRFVGSPWPRFRPANLVVIVPASAPLPQVVLLDTGSGQAFARPVGGTGTSDVAPEAFAADLQAKAAAAGGGQPAPEQLFQAQPASAVQEASISPPGGPPGASVVASGTGWPAGDRIAIEPCVGSRPETCSLRSELAVLATADAGGAFAGVVIRVPATVSPSDYVEFYLRDVRPGQRPYSFDVPWSVSGAACDHDCAAPSGCHPPYCDPAGKRGCRCSSRAEPVCALDSCDQCPPSRCARGLTALATPHATQTPRPPPTDTPSPRPSQQQIHAAPGSSGSPPATGHGTTLSATTSSGTRTGTASGSPATGTTTTTRTATASTSTSTSQSRSTPTPGPSGPSHPSPSATTGTQPPRTSPTPASPTATAQPSPPKPAPTATAQPSPPKPASTATAQPTPPKPAPTATAQPQPPPPTPTPQPKPPPPTPTPQPKPPPPTPTPQPKPPPPTPTPQPKPSQQSTPAPPPPRQGGQPRPGPSPTP